jgi:hypothetical protein
MNPYASIRCGRHLFDVLNAHTQTTIVLVQHLERYEMCNVAMLRVIEVNNTIF